MPQITKKCQDCPVLNVVVYQDKAEVKRSIQVDLTEAGENELIISAVVNTIDRNSVRVQGLGDAIITDVAFVENSIHKQMNEEDKHNWELMKQLKEAEHLKKRLQNQLNLLEEKTGAERIHDKLVMKDKSSSLLCSLGIDGLAKFLQFYEEKSADYDKQLMVVEEKIIQLKNNIRTRKLEKFSSKRNGGDDRSVAQISIFLHVQKPGQMTLELSYLVTSAGWSPSYDVRMISHDKLIQLNYYGKISQQSGEDWNDAKLFLSTARPCKSGDRPAICCQLLSICKPSKWVEITKKPKKWQKPTKAARRFGKIGGAPHKDPEESEFDNDDDKDDDDDDDDDDEEDFCYEFERKPMVRPMIHAKAKVHEGNLATTFEIIRKGSIPSNDAEHKVTIGQIQLVPELSYEAIPSVSSNAFQMAKVKNTSVYTFLPGPSSMFYDNNFVAQGQMRALYPQEEFTCYFGIDPAICILYKPPKIFTEELNEWFCRTKEAKVTTERFIQVRNNKSDAVRIKLIENIPRSTDEKIQVSLIEPLLDDSDVDSEVKMTKMNNLEWDLYIPAGQSKELKIKYEVKHPSGERFELEEILDY